MPDPIRLDGKVAVVTGAAGVIGRATIQRLAERGARIVAVDRKPEELAPITRYSLEAFRRVLDVNVVGVFLGLKHVLPVMLKQNKGSIINTASIAGLIGSPQIAVYSASKHAVIGLTRSAAWECTGTGVRVNCVCPGMIDSRMLSAIIDGRNAGSNAPTPHDRIVERIPARRLGQATEVAAIVAFLASDEASYVSGSAYTVDGGRTAA